MDATTYTGNGLSLSVTNTAGFKPDLVWGKDRTNIANHGLVDSVRGVSTWLGSNSTAAENTVPASYVTAFNSNGFTAGLGGVFNASGDNYVAWQWQAGQGTTSSNTSGSITSTVSVNPTAGFSVVTYTGTGANATVGHGLGVAPVLIIAKSRSGNRGWPVYSSTLGISQYLELNTTIAAGSIANYWGANSPSSTVFSLPNANYNNNVSGETYVAYCWSEIAGFSKFGSYTGNGSTDGPFVYTGFRPKFVMIKQSSASGENWTMYDSLRNPYNSTNSVLFADTSSAEFTSTSYVPIDLVSNGFKIRTDGAGRNSNGATYIYMAFAENPFKNALAR